VLQAGNTGAGVGLTGAGVGFTAVGVAGGGVGGAAIGLQLLPSHWQPLSLPHCPLLLAPLQVDA